LALLGWHPEDDQEILNLQELIQKFNLKKIQKAGAIFNIEKLEWLNAQYIKKTDSVELAEKIKDFIPENWQTKKDLLVKTIEAEKERMKTLADFKELADFFFELPDYEPSILKWQEMENEKIAANLKLLRTELENIDGMNFNKDNLEKIIMPLTEVWGRGELLWPLRAALSGKRASPGPFEIMEILGEQETLKRLDTAITKLS